jgi:hypothetical protein
MAADEGCASGSVPEVGFELGIHLFLTYISEEVGYFRYAYLVSCIVCAPGQLR